MKPGQLTKSPSISSCSISNINHLIPSIKTRNLFLFYQERLSGHFLRLLHPHQFNQGGGNVSQTSAFS